jgi:hypothetical protein
MSPAKCGSVVGRFMVAIAVDGAIVLVAITRERPYIDGAVIIFDRAPRGGIGAPDLIWGCGYGAVAAAHTPLRSEC